MNTEIFRHSKSLIAVIVTTLFAFSCSQEELDPSVNPSVKPELKLNVSPADIVLNENKYSDIALTFNWLDETVSDMTDMNYTLKISRKDVSPSLSAVLLDKKKDVQTLAITHEELNKVLLTDLEVSAGKAVELQAEVESGNGSVATAAFKVTSYGPVSESLYLIGSATANGWDADRAIPMQKVKNGLFTWHGHLEPGELKFITKLGQFLPSYNNGGDNVVFYRTSEDDPDQKFVIENATCYIVTVNLLSNYVSITTKFIDVPRFENLYFVGNPTGWNFEPLRRDLLDPFLFRYGRVFVRGGGGDFKFGTIPGSWENMYKATRPNAPYTDQSMSFVKGFEPDNKWFLQDSECAMPYKICIDIRPGKERMMMQQFKAFPNAWLAGTCVPEGPGTVINEDGGLRTEMKNWNSYIFEWTGYLKEGDLKIYCGNPTEPKLAWAMPGITREPDGDVEACLFVNNSNYFKNQYPTIDIIRVNYNWKITQPGYYKVVFDQLMETASIIRWGGDFKKITSNLCVNISTDKSIYAPGQTVTFKADNIPSDAKIRYRCNGHTVEEHAASGQTWTWNPPYDNYKGYMVEVYRTASTHDRSTEEVILGTIAVDVSGDWKRYPRYGFVGDFGADKLAPGVIRKEMEFLNRCHINGVQFYDWHNKHHWPLGGTREHLDPVYKDIANREVHTATVKKYIDIQHQYGMKCMFYNLCNGALEDGETDGVSREWAVYKNSNGINYQDQHPLPDNWKSNIYLLDPANPGWQHYLSERNDEVYSNFDFDGFHIDQLGDRGNLYAADGHSIWLPEAYGYFINAMKNAHPSKRLVMNAVGGYGSQNIAQTDKVEFMYNEVWGNQAEYRHLHEIIKANDDFSNHTKNTVFAAYMNYECSYRNFNEPGILLADAVMFSLGGAHLELGDHMLCREYFPNQDVKMSDELKTKIIRYYDFLTAYQNLLRGKSTSTETDPGISLVKAESAAARGINAWPPQKGKISSYAKKVDGKKVIHLVNFTNADQTSWRDLKGTMPEPPLIENLQVKVREDGYVQRIWMASPDQHAGALQELQFEKHDGYLWFTIPSLKYWDMIVIE